MRYEVEPTETGKKWKIVTDGRTVGTVERLSTGYLATLTEPPKVVKRFRLIDALTEALGEEAVIQIVE